MFAVAARSRGNENQDRWLRARGKPDFSFCPVQIELDVDPEGCIRSKPISPFGKSGSKGCIRLKPISPFGKSGSKRPSMLSWSGMCFLLSEMFHSMKNFMICLIDFNLALVKRVRKLCGRFALDLAHRSKKLLGRQSCH